MEKTSDLIAHQKRQRSVFRHFTGEIGSWFFGSGSNPLICSLVPVRKKFEKIDIVIEKNKSESRKG